MEYVENAPVPADCPEDNGILLTTKQVALLLQVQETTLEQWRWQGKGPKFIKLVRCVRYRRADIEAFLDDSTFASTTEAQAISSLQGAPE